MNDKHYDPKYKNYLAPIKYLNSHLIYEYDIAKANLSVLYSKGVISDEEYNIIKGYSRDARQMYFGMLQKDPEKSKALSEGLAEYREKFITTNNITDDKLLSVKNDAIYVIDTIPDNVEFDSVSFVRKNKYSSFYHLNKLEIYYLLDRINGVELIDVKGIREENLLFHQNHFIVFLCIVFEMIEKGEISSAIKYINDFYLKYINKELSREFYREFNSDSMYRIAVKDNQYLFEDIDQNMFNYIDISCNLNHIRDLYSIVSMIQFNAK